MSTDITEVQPIGAQLDAVVPARSRHLGLALVVISMAQLMLVLDELIVNTALPHIQQALHFSGTGLEWVVTAYAVTFGGLLMLGGRAGDILGPRRPFTGGVLFLPPRCRVRGLAPPWGAPLPRPGAAGRGRGGPRARRPVADRGDLPRREAPHPGTGHVRGDDRAGWRRRRGGRRAADHL